MSTIQLNPDLCIRYVADAAASSRFYASLLGRPPCLEQDGFAMFSFDSGLRLGLWAQALAQPSAAAGAAQGGGELGVLVADKETVRALHRDWAERGVSILQAPTDLDFGHTFVGADPDGHRIRIYALHAADRN